VDSAGYAVLKFQVHLRHGVFGENRRIGNIANGGGLNHVPDGESLNRFILWCASRAVGTADGLDVAATLLVSAV